MTERTHAARVAAWLVPAMLVFAGWRVLTLGVADLRALDEPSGALAWRENQPESLLLLASSLLQAGEDPARIESLARKAILANRLDGRPYRLMAQVAGTAGEGPRSERLHAIAGHLAKRDALAQDWMLGHSLATGRTGQAMAHLDLLLRVNPETLSPLAPSLARLAVDPQVRDDLIERLGTRPPWRGAFLRNAAKNAPLAGTASLFGGLRASAGGLEAGELEAWLDRLVAEGLWNDAYVTWASSLAPEQRGALGNLFNGSFEWPPAGAPFDWQFGKSPGTRIRLDSAGAASGRQALRVDFHGRRVSFSHVRQVLVLPPGHYRLSGQVRLEALAGPRGLVWTVSCSGGTQRPVDSGPFRGSSPWEAFSLDFEVPAEGCPAQVLLLRLPAQQAGDQRLRGSVWFDALRISRRTGPAGAATGSPEA